MSRYGSGTMSNASSNRPQIVELLVKKILAHLDDTDPQKLNQFLALFHPTNCKVVFNATPFAQLPLFLQMWQQQIVQTQHALTAVDYHVIPGSQTVVCNVNCKVRFDESGKDKQGQDATVTPGQQKPAQQQRSRPASRPLWGAYFGVSLQLVFEERVFNNDMNGVILALNYNMIYKPDDSLIEIM